MSTGEGLHCPVLYTFSKLTPATPILTVRRCAHTVGASVSTVCSVAHRPRQFTRLEILMNCGTPVHFAAGDFEFGCVPEERRGGLGGNKGKKSQESQVVALSRPTRVRRYTCICRRYTVSVEDTSYLSKIHAYLNSAKIRKRRPLHQQPHPLYIPLTQRSTVAGDANVVPTVVTAK